MAYINFNDSYSSAQAYTDSLNSSYTLYFATNTNSKNCSALIKNGTYYGIIETDYNLDYSNGKLSVVTPLAYSNVGSSEAKTTPYNVEVYSNSVHRVEGSIGGLNVILDYNSLSDDIFNSKIIFYTYDSVVSSTSVQVFAMINGTISSNIAYWPYGEINLKPSTLYELDIISLYHPVITGSASPPSMIAMCVLTPFSKN